MQKNGQLYRALTKKKTKNKKTKKKKPEVAHLAFGASPSQLRMVWGRLKKKRDIKIFKNKNER